MLNNIKQLLILGLLAFAFWGIYNYFANNQKVVLVSESKEESLNTDALTILYETSAESGEYQATSDTSWLTDGYKFNSELTTCLYGSEISWNKDTSTVEVYATSGDLCYVYFDVLTLADICSEISFSECIITELYTTDGEENLYYHDGSGDYSNANLEARDNSYRFSGASEEVDNFVCFGSDDATCPSDNLYRIIGVFNDSGEYQIKLVKYDYATVDLLETDGAYRNNETTPNSTYKGYLSSIPTYYWNNATGTTIWTESNLNLINLNTNFLNNIGSKWSSLIASHTWIAGGNTYTNFNTADAFGIYTYEIINPTSSTVYNGKVGLIYLSDYVYGISPEYWQNTMATNSSSEAATNYNWITMGQNEHTMNPLDGVSGNVLGITYRGNIGGDDVSRFAFAVRPAFYLSSSVTLVSGNGTESKPYRIA